jgi:2-dehydropantoate 2-reductase
MALSKYYTSLFTLPESFLIIPLVLLGTVCSNRLSPGKIDHSYGGKLVAGVAYSADADSDRGKWVESDKEAILDLFAPVSPVPFEFDPNLLRGRWWKNVWNLPFSGLSCAMGGITGEFTDD